MKKISLIFILFFALNNIFAQIPNQNEIKWLKENSIHINTVELGNGFTDLMPLKIIINNVKIVSLGEPTHGSSEIFKMKSRLIEFLAVEMGYNIFAIEANMAESYRLNEYVLNGNGEPEELLRGLGYWTWNTQEILDMILWIREYNKSGKGKIQFVGFDMNSYFLALQNILDFKMKDKHLIKILKDIEKNHFSRIKNYKKGIYKMPKGLNDSLYYSTKDLYEYISERKSYYLKNLINNKYEWLKQNAKLLYQYATMYSDFKPEKGFRDKCLAENIEWIINNNLSTSKIIIWAHNGHIKKDNYTMGGYLDKIYKDSILVIGFATGKGTYTAINKGELTSNPLVLPDTSCYEYYLQSINIPIYIIDLKKASNNNINCKWLFKDKTFREIGSIKKDLQFYKSNITKEYDAIIYINETNSSMPLKIEY